jgi:hypothetical protein
LVRAWLDIAAKRGMRVIAGRRILLVCFGRVDFMETNVGL